jgi:hypothetical protein
MQDAENAQKAAAAQYIVRGSAALPLATRHAHLIALTLAGWFVAVEAGTQLWYRAHERASAQRENWRVQIPSDYRIKELPPLVTSEFKYDEGTNAEWEDQDGGQWQLFYFRWNPARSLNRRVVVQRAKMHGPTTCLPQIGMSLKSDLGPRLIVSANLTLIIQHYVFEIDGAALDVFFGIYEDQTGSTILANRRLETASRVQAAFAGSRNSGQRFLEVAVRGYDRPEAAQAAFVRELGKLAQVSR